jgi:hypothetical protein
VCLIVITGLADADSSYVFGNSNHPEVIGNEYVTATVTGNTIVFTLIQGNAPIGWFDQIGIPTSYFIADVTHLSSLTGTDNKGNTWKVKKTGDRGKLNAYYSNIPVLGSVVEFDAPNHATDPHEITQVTITCDNVPTDKPTLGAHVAWGINVNGYSSAWYDSTLLGQILKPTQIPEFPSIVIPVATIIGFLFIINRMKK